MDKPRILVADDDQALLSALKTRFEHMGFDVIVAADGYRALVSARDDHVDLLILDVHMPAGSGFSVQNRLEQLAPSDCRPSGTTPVIYITGDTSEYLQDVATELGAFALVRKPFETEQLCQTIRRALEQPPQAA